MHSTAREKWEEKNKKIQDTLEGVRGEFGSVWCGRGEEERGRGGGTHKSVSAGGGGRGC